MQPPHKPAIVRVHCYCCNLSGGVALIMWFTTRGMCVRNKTIIYEARGSNSKRDCEHDLYCCLLPLGISDRNKMVLWPGLGRREVSLHTSEEATACSSLNCAARCILCSLASCRFANCAICSLVAGFVFHDCVLASRALLKFFSSSLFACCETTADFTIVGHATIFCVSPGNGRRLDITSAKTTADTISNITAQTIGDCSV